jgi:phosphoglycerate dehydrogenase-like enzyme
MQRTQPRDTTLTICVWHPFTLWRAPEWVPQRILNRWREMHVIHVPGYDELPSALPETDILLGFSLRPEQFALARKLQWIHATAAGVGQLMYPALRQSGVVVTNARGIHAVPMAEHALGMMIAMARRFPQAMRAQADSRWAQQEIWDGSPRPSEMAGATLLLVGFGAVGRQLARLAKPLGMRVRAVTRSGLGDASLAEHIAPSSALENELERADFVVLAAPETPETYRMMSAAQFARMKRSAYLISLARGTLVDEAALALALVNGVIGGAALDVTEHEPLPPASPLWRLENVFLTPHMSAVSDALWERQTELLLENLERWFSGRELLNQVNLERGY